MQRQRRERETVDGEDSLSGSGVDINREQSDQRKRDSGARDIEIEMSKVRCIHSDLLLRNLIGLGQANGFDLVPKIVEINRVADLREGLAMA